MTAKEAIATHIGWDYSEMSDYQYQPCTWNRKIYNVDEYYFTASKSIKEPVVKSPTQGYRWGLVWHLVDTIDGWNIFRSGIID
jgi:hypothetical protein